jgi:integrase
MMLTLCYGCGLRVSELLAVKVSHVDGERRLLRVEQGSPAAHESGPAIALGSRPTICAGRCW